MNLICIGSHAAENQTRYFYFLRVNFLVKTSTSGGRDQVRLPWQRTPARPNMAVFVHPPR